MTTGAVAGFGLPNEGEMVVCGKYVYEWDVVEEIDEFHERWGWSLFCPVVDAAKVYGLRNLPVVQSLPQYD